MPLGPEHSRQALKWLAAVDADTENQGSSPPPAYPDRMPPEAFRRRLDQTFEDNPNISFLPPRDSRPMFDQAAHPSRPMNYEMIQGGRVEVEEEEEDQEDDDDEVSSAPINVRISTAVRVSANNNLITLAVTPADQAAAIAEATIEALRSSADEGGLPMLDENGAPRPINIEVDAGIDVNGSGNVIGDQATIQEVLKQRAQARKRGRTADGSEAEPEECEARTKRGRIF